MSRVQVVVLERGRLPAQMSVTVEPGEAFVLTWRDDRQERLRRILPGPRRGDGGGRLGANEIVALRIEPGERPIAVEAYNPAWKLFHVLDDARRRVVTDEYYPAGSRFRLMQGSGAEERELAEIVLDLATGEARGLSSAVGGSDHRRSNADALATPAGWILPSATATLQEPLDALLAKAEALKKKLAALQTPLMYLVPYALFAGAGGVLYVNSTADLRAAEDQVQALDGELKRAQQALDAAAAGLEECNTNRVALAGQVEERRLQHEAAARAALDAMRSRKAALSLVVADAAALDAIDTARVDALVAAIADQMAVDRAPDPAVVGPCLAQDVELAGRLPVWALLWHPVPEELCPDSSTVLGTTVALKGRWGLSDRIADELGPADLAVAGEALANDRWAANTLANAWSAIHGELIEPTADGRAPVAPGEAEAWALALTHAYGQLPAPLAGTLDTTVEACVSGLVASVEASAKAAEVGEPVLPPLAAVAKGQALEGVRPNPGCPWTAASFPDGAAATVRAIARRASIVQEEALLAEAP